MVQLVLLLNTAQDTDRVLDGRLSHHNGLEPARKGRVFFDVFAVLIQRGRADTMQFAPGKRGLDQVGGIHRAVGLPSAHQRVHLVDEQDDLTGSLGHLGQNGLEALFELTTVLRTSDQRTHVERQQLLVLQRFRHVAVDDAQGHALGNRGFTDAGLPDQNRVVLGAARQNLHRAADFLIPPDDRVDLALGRCLGQVTCVFLERVIAFLRRGSVSGATLANVVDRLIQFLRGYGPGLQRVLGFGFHHAQRHQHAFNRHKTVAGLGGDLGGLVQNLGGLAVHVNLARIAADLGDFPHRGIQCLNHTIGRAARTSNQVARQPLIVIHQCFEYMCGLQPLVPLAQRNGLRGLHESPCPLGELVQVHGLLLFTSAPV